jgi:hypothetical protein
METENKFCFDLVTFKLKNSYRIKQKREEGD